MGLIDKVKAEKERRKEIKDYNKKNADEYKKKNQGQN